MTELIVRVHAIVAAVVLLYLPVGVAWGLVEAARARAGWDHDGDTETRTAGPIERVLDRPADWDRNRAPRSARPKRE